MRSLEKKSVILELFQVQLGSRGWPRYILALPRNLFLVLWAAVGEGPFSCARQIYIIYNKHESERQKCIRHTHKKYTTTTTTTTHPPCTAPRSPDCKIVSREIPFVFSLSFFFYFSSESWRFCFFKTKQYNI